MNSLNLDDIDDYINEGIENYYQRLTASFQELQLNYLFRGNPYLFGLQGTGVAGTLIKNLLDAFLLLSEEKLFGDFLENLAIFIAGKTCNGRKSTAPGIDLEFENNGIYYIVSVKSGPNWGNSSQQDKLEQDLKKATMRVKQSHLGINAQPVLGICYGNIRTSFLRSYLKVVGQNFWYLISENQQLYTDIIEPIGYRAKEHNDSFYEQKARVVNRFTGEFIGQFCDEAGAIDWMRLVEFNSGNYDLDQFLS